MTLHITPDDDINCGKCGADYPADADTRNDYHDEECDDYGRVLTEGEAADEFVDLLNDCYDSVTVCGYTYAAGEALHRLDPVAFRQELLNYCDAHGIEIV